MSASRTRTTRRRSFASLGGYSGIAQRLGTKPCDCGSWVTRTGRQRYQLFNHEAGFTSYRMAVIHWRDRPVTRRGIYRFLKLVAQTRIRPFKERGLLLFEINIEANALARQLGIRFPRAFADHDRARVRLWLGRTDLAPDLRRRIAAWARG